MVTTLEPNLACESGEQWQPAQALRGKMGAMLEIRLSAEKCGQRQPALAMLSEMLVATPEVGLPLEKGVRW